jgi:hypothetical protein
MLITYPQLATVNGELDYDDCVTYVGASGANFDELQLYFALIFETGLI